MQVVTLVNVVVASCILHNICDLQDNVFLEDWEPDVIPLGQPPTVVIVDAAARTDATVLSVRVTFESTLQPTILVTLL